MNLGLASKFTQYSDSHLAYNYSIHQSDLLTNFYGKISTGRCRNRNLSKIDFFYVNEFEHAHIYNGIAPSPRFISPKNAAFMRVPCRVHCTRKRRELSVLQAL